MRSDAAPGTRMRPAVPNTCPSLSRRGPRLPLLVELGGFFDTALGFVLLAGDALGIDPQQDLHAVACPVGDLGRWYSSVEPYGQRRVAKVIGPPGQH